MKLVITAGFDGSIPAIAMCELLRRSGHSISAVIVVTPFSAARLKSMLKQRGIQGLKKVAKKLIPSKKSNVKFSQQAKFLLDHKISFTSLKSMLKGIQNHYNTNPEFFIFLGGFPNLPDNFSIVF